MVPEALLPEGDVSMFVEKYTTYIIWRTLNFARQGFTESNVTWWSFAAHKLEAAQHFSRTETGVTLFLPTLQGRVALESEYTTFVQH